MEQLDQKIPHIFISYSWTTLEHEEWVANLATRLADDGVYVHFDKWDLREGHDKFKYMESMVTSKDIDKVLIICDSGYKKKADNRAGGVGTETQIITPEIYSQAEQEKFVPILAERDEHGKEIFPAFISSRIYIDLSSPDTFEENYEKLLRVIYEKPLHKRPPLGKRPAFLSDEEATDFQTAKAIRKMSVAAEKDPRRLKYLWNEFTVLFFESLELLRIDEVPDPSILDDQVVEKIDASLPLRNDYIKALELMCEFEKIDSEYIVELFEEMFSFTEYRGSGGTFYELQMDQYRFLITELFIYAVAVLLKHKRFDLIADLLYTEYHVQTKYQGNNSIDFSDFRFYVQSLETRNQRLSLRRVSVHSDILHKRIFAKYKDEFFSADLLLYNVDRFKNDHDGWRWFPYSYIYLRESGTLRLFSKLKSKKHFENTKLLYNVDSPEELQEKVQSIEDKRGFSGVFGTIPSIKHFIKPEEICTIP